MTCIREYVSGDDNVQGQRYINNITVIIQQESHGIDDSVIAKVMETKPW